MKKTIKTAILSLIIITTSNVTQLISADYSEGRHSKDYTFLQFNLMHGMKQKNPFGNDTDTYLEMEFGGKKGIVDLYGYIDVLDIAQANYSTMHGSDNFFGEIKPRLSLDSLFKKDLSFLFVEEIYIATAGKFADNGLAHYSAGLGTDINVWGLGKVGVNFYSLYKAEDYGSSAEGKFDGYHVDINWFTPLYTFKNNTFIAYQGYFNYTFGSDNVALDAGRTSTELQTFQGLYWHSQNYAVGYGLKLMDNMAFYKDGTVYDSTTGASHETAGAAHYFTVTYKF